jgi:hypothetical protein
VEFVNATYYPEPAEAQSIKSMFHITRILALVFGIILLLAGLALAALDAAVYSTCTAVAGNVCAGIGFILIGPIILIIFGVIDFIIFVKVKSIEGLVNNRQYEQAKSATLVWMILGFILGGLIIGILLLIAYLKFDPLINASRQASGQMPPPGYGAPPAQPQSWAPPPAGAPAPGAPQPMAPPPAPPMAQPAAAVPFCANCGKPTTYIPQYGRYYCYDCKQYV